MVCAISTVCLLAGCELKLEVYLYNNIDTAITVGLGSTGKKLTIAPHAIAYVNECWGRYAVITRQGKTYRYTEPMSGLPPGYTDGNGFELWQHFEFANDNCVYILPKGTLPGRTPPQPEGFPLKPQ